MSLCGDLAAAWQLASASGVIIFLKNECLSRIFFLEESVLFQLRLHSQNYYNNKSLSLLPLSPFHYTWLIPLILITINSSSEKTTNSFPGTNLHHPPPSQLIMMTTFALYSIATPSLPIPSASPFAIAQSHHLSDLHPWPSPSSTARRLDLEQKQGCLNLLTAGRDRSRIEKGKNFKHTEQRDFDTMRICLKAE